MAIAMAPQPVVGVDAAVAVLGKHFLSTGACCRADTIQALGVRFRAFYSTTRRRRGCTNIGFGKTMCLILAGLILKLSQTFPQLGACLAVNHLQ